MVSLMNRHHNRIARWLIGCLAVLVFGTSALAQKEPEWSQICGLAQLTATDKKDVRTWIDAQIKQILAETAPVKARQQGKSFYTELADSYRAGTNSFKDTVSKAAAESFVAHYKSPAKVDASSPHPHGRLYVMMALVAFKQPGALEGYQKALADPSSGVRERAASGLLQHRDGLNPDQWNNLLPLIKKTALSETNSVVLSRLYALLSVNQNQRANASMPIVLDILDARCKRFEQKWNVPRLADGEAAVWLGGRFAAVNDQPTKKKIALAVARLMADSVYVYTKQALKPYEKHALEAVILASETQLQAMVNANATPNISTIMIKGVKDQDKNTAMLAELDKWIGSDDGAGILNGAPLNLPAGLNIQRAPLSTTQPAE